MVNAAKRMRKLAQQLLEIRNGPGAGVLPTSSATQPQLTSIYMRIPSSLFPKDHPVADNTSTSASSPPSNPNSGTGKPSSNASRLFRRDFLRRLKYYNPSLPIKIEQTDAAWKDSGYYMSLNYEAPKREVLERINTSFTKISPQSSASPFASSSSTPSLGNASLASKRPGDVDTQSDARIELPSDKVEVKLPSSTSTATADASSSTSGSEDTVYTRTVTLPLQALTYTTIRAWFTQTLGVKLNHVREGEDKEIADRIWREASQAGQDRKRVREGVEKMRKEKEDLKMAREAADRLAAEA